MPQTLTLNIKEKESNGFDDLDQHLGKEGFAEDQPNHETPIGHRSEHQSAKEGVGRNHSLPGANGGCSSTLSLQDKKLSTQEQCTLLQWDEMPTGYVWSLPWLGPHFPEQPRAPVATPHRGSQGAHERHYPVW